jgi:alginate O-acetyltransferase complex protein AlgI
MLFFSYQFVTAVAVFFIAYWAIPWSYARRVLLLTACIIFHWHFAGPAGVLPIVVLGVGAYFAGRSRNVAFCTTWIVVCVAALIFYKYTHFLSESLLGLLAPHLVEDNRTTLNYVLPVLPPLGISFFTFEFVHYLIEVRRGHRPIRSPLSFALFAIFWPSLVAGPIKRYRQYIVSLSRGVRSVSQDDVMLGMIRLSIGIIKKFGGDLLTGWIALQEPHYDMLAVHDRWRFLIAIGLRIFLDFSGYSDMAIGFARMMGIRLPENFNRPYLAVSVTDFWRRWHISLSTWIRDYVYIPLGGSRHGPVRKAFNALLAMVLCGLWHGAAWNFAVWGILHGVGLIVSGAKPYARIAPALVRGRPRLAALLEHPAAAQGRIVMSWIMTATYVLVGWLFFFYPLDQALHMTRLLFMLR